MRSTVNRIVTDAIARVDAGADPIDAIEDACATVSASSGSRDFARRIALTLFARAECEAAAS